MIRSPIDGLIYVVHLMERKIEVYDLSADGKLTHIDSILTPYPVDNLDVDSKGDIYAAGFPKAYLHQEFLDKGRDVLVPMAVLRIRRTEGGGKKEKRGGDGGIYKGGYVVEKVLEDDGSVLPSTTKAVHDPKTGRIFMAGIAGQFVAVCEPRK
jgi:arylesterase/paraoxonase